MAKNTLRNTGLAAATVTATLGMAFGCAQSTTAENNSSCPPINTEGEASINQGDSVATRLMEQLGASVVRTVGVQCERYAADETVTATKLGNGVVHLALSLPIPASGKDKPGGSYSLHVTTVEGYGGELSPSGITDFSIAENVRGNNGQETTLFALSAKFDSATSWDVAITDSDGTRSINTADGRNKTSYVNDQAKRAYEVMDAERYADPIPSFAGPADATVDG